MGAGPAARLPRGSSPRQGRAGPGTGGGEHCFLQRTGNEPPRGHERDLKTNAAQPGGTSRLISQLLRPGAAGQGGRRGEMRGDPSGTARPSRVGLGEQRRTRRAWVHPAKEGPSRFWLHLILGLGSMCSKVFFQPRPFPGSVTHLLLHPRGVMDRGCSGPRSQPGAAPPAPLASPPPASSSTAPARGFAGSALGSHRGAPCPAGRALRALGCSWAGGTEVSEIQLFFMATSLIRS